MKKYNTYFDIILDTINIIIVISVAMKLFVITWGLNTHKGILNIIQSNPWVGRGSGHKSNLTD